MKTKIKFFNQNVLETIIVKSKSAVAEKLLLLLSFLESIIFPVPIDPLLALLIFNNPNKFIKLSILCTVASVFGGLFSWFLGYLLGNEVEKFFEILPWISANDFNDVKIAFTTHGVLIVFLGAFTPLPFKLIAITSGVFNVNLFAFLIMSFIGRGIRFLIVGFIVKKYGNYGVSLLKNKIFLFTSIIGIMLIIIYILSF